jgi:hypothetical protein
MAGLNISLGLGFEDSLSDGRSTGRRAMPEKSIGIVVGAGFCSASAGICFFGCGPIFGLWTGFVRAGFGASSETLPVWADAKPEKIEIDPAESARRAIEYLRFIWFFLRWCEWSPKRLPKRLSKHSSATFSANRMAQEAPQYGQSERKSLRFYG